MNSQKLRLCFIIAIFSYLVAVFGFVFRETGGEVIALWAVMGLSLIILLCYGLHLWSFLFFRKDILSESEQKYRSIIENSQDGVALFDNKGIIVEWNYGLEKITGLSKTRAKGKPYWEIYSILAPKDVQAIVTQEQLKKFLPVLLKENQDHLPEIKIKSMDGRERTIQLLTYVIKNDESTMVGGIIRDVSEQKAIEESMTKYAQRLEVLYRIGRDVLRTESLKELAEVILLHLRQLIQCRRASIFIIDQQLREPIILCVDTEGETKWGPGSRLSADLYRFPEELQKGKEFLANNFLDVFESCKVFQDIANEGNKSYLSVPLLAYGELIGSINLGADKYGFFNEELIEITRQVANHFAIAVYQARLHEQLRENREQLRELAKRLVKVQEEERRNLSRELHDDAGQELTALKIMLNLISQDLFKGNHEIQSRLAESINLTDTIMEKIRALAQNLRPPALDTVGLVPALEELCNDFSRRTDITLKFQGVQALHMPESYQICLYRILQESLTNIAKHAKARQVSVQLINDGNVLYLSVEDDGIGFFHNSQRGMGLLDMQERVEALGGSLQIQTGKGEGTRIIAAVPWKEGFNG